MSRPRDTYSGVPGDVFGVYAPAVASDDDRAYGFRVGERNYPREIAGPFETHAEAKETADVRRAQGWPVGRIHRTTFGGFERVVNDMRKGISSW